MKTLSGPEFSRLLHNDELVEPIVVSGYAKASPDPGHFFLDISGNCTRWVKIPVQMVADDGVKWFGKAKCGDEVFDFVEIALQPATKGEAGVLSELLRRQNHAKPDTYIASPDVENESRPLAFADSTLGTDPTTEFYYELPKEDASTSFEFTAPSTINRNVPSARAAASFADLDAYGNWCGSFNTGRGWNDPPPIDGLDHACMEHDLDIKKHRYHRCYADGKLMRKALPYADFRVGNYPDRTRRGTYAANLYTVFQVKPCQCEKKVCHPCRCRTVWRGLRSYIKCDQCCHKWRTPGIGGRC